MKDNKTDLESGIGGNTIGAPLSRGRSIQRPNLSRYDDPFCQIPTSPERQASSMRS